MPLLGAPVEEAQRERDEGVGHLHEADAPGAAPVADQELAAPGVVGAVAEVAAEPGHVVPAVVEDEQEPARQPGQAGFGQQRAVQAADQRPEVGAAAAQPGQRRRHDVADALVGGGGQEPGPGDRVLEPAPDGLVEPADLDAAARGELQQPAAVRLREAAELVLASRNRKEDG